MLKGKALCDRIEAVLKRLLPLFLLILYTFFGAFLFHLIEEPNELSSKEELQRKWKENRMQTARRVEYIHSNRAASNQEKFNETVVVLGWFQRQVGAVVPEENKWTFWGAMFYSMTLYTTIGYGYQYPRTMRGQVVTIIYSIFGIPLALMALIQLGYSFAYLCQMSWSALNRFIACCQYGREWRKVRPTDSEVDNDLLSFPVSVLILLTVLWLLGSAGLFLLWETEWDYWTSLYFTYISFTTIGLGDVTPSRYDFMVVSGVFIMIGLSLVSTSITMIQMQIEALVKGVQDSIEKQYQEAQKDSEEGAALSTEPKKMERAFQGMVNQMPGSSKMLFKFLPGGKKEQLQSLYKRKAVMKSQGCQTDKFLLQGLKLDVIEEDRRSHDDVNSLVAACDYALR